jgi:LmbE family N-acetylglucosaminyl deacetylase
MKNIIVFILISLLGTSLIFSQTFLKSSSSTSSEIYESIKKLNFLGTVLYIAAHPDDENTRLISYFANQVYARTAYLSLTRGDGGQNLIGQELRELLGVIRTQELLAARRIDGGEQFFTRANDFGYSKSPSETLLIWNKKEILKDVVTLIRKLKPDVIINRFDYRTPRTTHGHHTTSAMLSVEAFDLANDKNYKTNLLKDEIWQPKRLFFNTSWWFYGSKEKFAKADKSKMISLPTGNYFPLKGESNGEIAALSRSKHESQGFGSAGVRGAQNEYVEFIQGDFPSNKDVFDGIDTSWNRIEGGAEIKVILDGIINNYNFNNPAASIPDLLKAYQLILNLKNDYWRDLKKEQIKNIIANCAGLFMEVNANNSSASPNSTIELNFEFINRCPIPINIASVQPNFSDSIVIQNKNLLENIPLKFKFKTKIPKNTSYTSPYWLLKKGSIGMYTVLDKSLIGLPETPSTLNIEIILNVNGVLIPFRKKIGYKYVNPKKGEVYQPFEILPKAMVNLGEKVYLFSNNQSKKIKVKVKSGVNNLNGELRLSVPKNWIVSPKVINIQIGSKGVTKNYWFDVTPPDNSSSGKISPIIQIGNSSFTYKLEEINYNHIPFQSVLMPSEAKVARLNIKKAGQKVAYIHGAGDEIPTSLRQIGYTVVELKEKDINPVNLKNFDAVVLGIRAYNTNKNLKFYQKELFDYVKNGGTLITQYNTNLRLKVKQVAPYPLSISRDRVTDENSKVTFLNPQSELLNFPNKITENDFKGWVQERGLYFPNKWDSKFEAVLGMHDTNESIKKGSLLVAKYGKGNFIYTGLSFFRELPAGVPGAYKLFSNMLSVGKNKFKKHIKH